MQLQTVLLATLALTTIGLSLYYTSGSSKDYSYVKEYMKFRNDFKGLSSSPEEFEYRYSIFVDNMKFIEQQNSQNKSFTIGVNQFSDLTWEEFKNAYLSEAIYNEVHSNGKSDDLDIDWREKNAVTSVKNQRACGSCWAFSTTGSMETALFQQNGTLVSLSEQQLVDCSESYGNHGCGGGLMNLAFDYITDNKLASEKDYPYKAVQQNCKATEESSIYGIKGYKTISPINVSGLSQALQKNTVSVAIEVRRDFQMYKGGIYTADASCGQQLNHGVLLVGQKDNYYVVKNSWSESWGEKGYIRMEIGSGSGTCGIANFAAVYPF